MIRVDLPHPTKEYDPVHPQYPETPGYEAPEPQDLFPTVPHTPPFRLESREWPPPGPPSYRQSLFFAHRFDELIQQVRDLREAGEPVPANLATFYELAMGPMQLSLDPNVTGPAPFMDMAGSLPGRVIDPRSDPALDELAIQLTPMPMEEMATDQLFERSVPEIDASTPGLFAGAMEMSLSDMAEAMMPAAEPSVLMEVPMMDPPDPIGDSHTMTLDAIVEQLMPEPAPQAEMPDPFALMQNQFNQQMQMMDPFNMMGPMM